MTATPSNSAGNVQAYFARASADWSDRYKSPPRGMADLDLRLRREHTQAMVRAALQHRDGAGHVLDLGCGSGDVLDGLSRERMHVTGVDFSPEMVSTAAEHHPKDRFAAADAMRIPFRDESFDIVICLGTLEYVKDPATALRTILSVLKPGGTFIVSFPNQRSLFRRLLRVERSLERGLVQIRNRLSSSRGSESDKPYDHRQWNLRECIQLLGETGFHTEEAVMHTYGPWGRLGRTSIALKASEWLSRRFQEAGPISGCAACTMVIRAIKPAQAQCGHNSSTHCCKSAAKKHSCEEMMVS